MPVEDVATEVVRTSWLGRLGGSLFGALIGFCLFIASFFLLFWNEGRAVQAIQALDAGARIVVSASADRIDPANEGKLIHVAGPSAVAGPLVDPAFRVGGAGLLRLERKVEMFQWKEKSESSTEKHVGGSETTTTTYRYVQDWSDSPVASARFKHQEGRVNPAMPYRGTVWNAAVSLGAFTLSGEQIGRIHDFRPLAPNPAGGGAPPAGFRVVGDYLYSGASWENPAVGDVRVSFQAVPTQPLTVVAAQRGNALVGYQTAGGYVVDLAEPGVLTADAMFADARSGENFMTWALRGVGFLMMWIGLALVASPLSWLASLLPFLAAAVDVAVGALALTLALPLTLGVIAVAWLTYRPLLGGGLLVAGVVAAFLVRRFAASRAPAGRPDVRPA